MVLGSKKSQIREAQFTVWAKGDLVDDTSLVLLHANTTRWKWPGGLHTLCAKEEAGAQLGIYCIPLDDPPVKPSVPTSFADPQPALKSIVEAHLPNWTACLSPADLRQLGTLVWKIDADDQAAGSQEVGHRERAVAGTAAVTVVLGLEDHTTSMRALQRDRYTLRIYARKLPALQTPREPHAADWGFNASEQAGRARRMQLTDVNVIHSL